MGIFWDKLKTIFIRKKIPILAEIAVSNANYNRYERQDISYNHKLTVSKIKSQRRNWRKWRGRK